MKDINEIHPIQEAILKRLSYGKGKSFSRIKGDIESNKLSFHLKKLQENNLIEKTDMGYKLTQNGREVLPYFDLETARHPVIVVDLLVFSRGKIYLLPKQQDPLDPFVGSFRAPSTRIGTKDRLEEAARELFIEEFGREPENLRESAVFDSEVEFEDGSKQHYIVFYFKTDEEEIDAERLYSMEELSRIDLLPGLEETVKTLGETDDFLFGEWDIIEKERGFGVKKLDINQR